MKVRVNPDGIFTIASATMYEPRIVEEVPAEAMEVDGDAKTEAPAEPLEPVKKTKLVPVDLEVIESIPVSYDVQKFHNLELQMQESDAREKAKADAKNSLEEYVYEMRDKVSDQYAEFITPAAADEFRSVLTSTEDWLYDEGEDAERDVYEKRLSELKAVGTPVVERYRESETRKPAFDSFDQSIMRVRKAYEDYANGGPTYAHLDSKEMEKVINAIEDKKKWLDEARHKQETRSKTDAPVVFTEEILQNKNVSRLNSIYMTLYLCFRSSKMLSTLSSIRRSRPHQPHQRRKSPSLLLEINHNLNQERWMSIRSLHFLSLFVSKDYLNV